MKIVKHKCRGYEVETEVPESIDEWLAVAAQNSEMSADEVEQRVLASLISNDLKRGWASRFERNLALHRVPDGKKLSDFVGTKEQPYETVSAFLADNDGFDAESAQTIADEVCFPFYAKREAGKAKSVVTEGVRNMVALLKDAGVDEGTIRAKLRESKATDAEIEALFPTEPIAEV